MVVGDCSLILTVIQQGVTFKDYLDFFSFLRNIGEAEIALTFHNAAGKAIDPGISIINSFHHITPLSLNITKKYLKP